MVPANSARRLTPVFETVTETISISAHISCGFVTYVCEISLRASPPVRNQIIK